jgi:hypothetical protein
MKATDQALSITVFGREIKPFFSAHDELGWHCLYKYENGEDTLTISTQIFTKTRYIVGTAIRADLDKDQWGCRQLSEHPSCFVPLTTLKDFPEELDKALTKIVNPEMFVPPPLMERIINKIRGIHIWGR